MIFGKRIETPDEALLAAPAEEPADFGRRVRDSLLRQEARRRALEARLLEAHGCNAVRPFFLFGEGVYNSALGCWLVLAMDLLPYDEWNTVYLPLDAQTMAALDLPLHPRQAIDAVDQLIHDRLSELHAQYAAGQGDGIAAMRGTILDYAAALFPRVIAMLDDIQREQGLRQA